MTNEKKDVMVLDYNDRQVIETLRKTVAANATDAEFAMFINFARGTGLNPYKKELWFIKTSCGVQMMTGINGFFAIANAHPQYDGMECDLEVNQAGRPIKATAKAYRKDRKFPSVGIALMSESGKNSPVWNQQPSVMLAKVAKARALREAFPQELNGLYTDDEMPREYAAAVEPETETSQQPWTPKPYAEMALPPRRYAVPDVTREQELFFEKRGYTQIEPGIFEGSADLGERLEPYRVRSEKVASASQSALTPAESLEAKPKRGRPAKTDGRSEKWAGKAPKEESRMVTPDDEGWIQQAEEQKE